MRKVILSQNVSLDGFFAGPNGELDWPVVEDEFNEYAVSMLDSIDTILFGRVTYRFMADYWPSAAATKENPVTIVNGMNDLNKVVFSKTLERAEWRNSRLVRGDIGEEVARMKQEPGKDMVIFGSGGVASALARQGLIDEYRILVHPIVLGSGRPLFEGLKDRVGLKLVESKTFNSGVVLLRYVPAMRKE